MSQHPQEKNEHSYKYFLLGTNNPVRVTFNHEGLKLGAETPDTHTQKLKIENTLLSRLETSPDVEEIDLTQFTQLCQEVYAKKNFSNRGKGPQLTF